MELAIAIASVFLTAAIAYAVHIYRPKIGYELHCAEDKFYIANDRIGHQGEGLWTTIEIGTLYLKNPSSSDVEEFEIIFEGHFRHSKFSVYNTSSISKDAIKFENSPSGPRVSLKRFPKNEEISIRYSIIDHSGLKYVNPKKSDRKFELYNIDTRRRAIKAFSSGLAFALCLFPLGILGAFVFKLFLELI